MTTLWDNFAGPDEIVITKAEYARLLDDSRVLEALHASGVDNWEWYSDSIHEYYPEHFKD